MKLTNNQVIAFLLTLEGEELFQAAVSPQFGPITFFGATSLPTESTVALPLVEFEDGE